MGGTCIWESLWFALRRSVGENIFGEFGKSIYDYYCRDALDKSYWMVSFLFTLDQKMFWLSLSRIGLHLHCCDAVELFFLLWSSQDWVIARMWCQSRKNHFLEHHNWVWSHFKVLKKVRWLLIGLVLKGNEIFLKQMNIWFESLSTEAQGIDHLRSVQRSSITITVFDLN